MYNITLTVKALDTRFDTDERKLARTLALIGNKHPELMTVEVTRIVKPKPVKFKGVGDDKVTAETVLKPAKKTRK